MVWENGSKQKIAHLKIGGWPAVKVLAPVDGVQTALALTDGTLQWYERTCSAEERCAHLEKIMVSETAWQTDLLREHYVKAEVWATMAGYHWACKECCAHYADQRWLNSEPGSIKSSCDETGVALTVSGGGWWHRPGTTHDLYSDEHKKLAAAQQREYVLVRNMADLGGDLAKYPRGALRGSQLAAAWAAAGFESASGKGLHLCYEGWVYGGISGLAAALTAVEAATAFKEGALNEISVDQRAAQMSEEAVYDAWSAQHSIMSLPTCIVSKLIQA